MRVSFKDFTVFWGAVSLMMSSAAVADTRAEIEAFDQEMAAAANRGDARAISQMYTTDAEIFDESVGVVKGTEAVEKYFKQGLADGFGSIHFKSLEVYRSGNYATEVGEYSWGDRSGKVIDHGHYIVIYRKEGGRWKLYRDSPTSDAKRTS